MSLNTDPRDINPVPEGDIRTTQYPTEKRVLDVKPEYLKSKWVYIIYLLLVFLIACLGISISNIVKLEDLENRVERDESDLENITGDGNITIKNTDNLTIGLSTNMTGIASITAASTNLIMRSDVSVTGNFISGENNTLTSSESSSIVGGSQNNVTSSENSSIVGGNENGITGSNRSSILGGGGNALRENTTGEPTKFSSIVSGQNNGMCGSGWCSIVGGQYNSVTGCSNSAVIGGRNNNMQNCDTTVFLSGNGLSCNPAAGGTSYNNCVLMGWYNDLDKSNAILNTSPPPTNDPDRISLIIGGGSGNSARGNAFQVDNKGNVYLGDNSNQGACIYQYGGGSYNAKAFTIQHPEKEENWLMHGCLEGPEGGVYYRGKDTAPTEVRLPSYASKIAKDFTVNVTPIGDPRMMSVSEVSEEGVFKVNGEGKFFWTAMGERVKMNPEPRKTDVVVKNVGPYTWLE